MVWTWIDLAQARDQWRALVNMKMNVGLEVFTAVVMKGIIVWDMILFMITANWRLLKNRPAPWRYLVS
jgi:hypothetical protein